jgi:NADPH-dependent glutamate synthase beta subunit-like oxidoreductase
LENPKTIISKEFAEKLLDVEKLKYCFECGICTASCSMVELLGKDYNPRRLLENILLNPEDVLASDELWLCAWCYSCYNHCPQALRIPEIFNSVRSNAAKHGYTQPLEKALKKIVENVPLPLVTTLVCFHPERAGLNMEEVLGRIEKMRSERFKIRKRKKTTKDSGGKIAVIGSGPAGLTVAYEQARKGHRVTIFESLNEPGGMLRKCIPECRLPKKVLAKEVQFIKDLGVEIRTGITVGKDLSFDDLSKEGFKTIFIGSGAHKSQKLKIEGGDLKGVVHALDFLWSVNCGEEAEIGKNVIVIGGGNVAVDIADTTLRLGAEKVNILYRRSREEMPANPWEVKEIEDRGVKIEFLVGPKKILGENGKVASIECVRMQLGEHDESGRRKPVPVEGSEHVRETDMVILAVGEVPDLEFLPKSVELNEDGTVWVDPITMETSLQGVFAGGDVVTGPATVIQAILAGKRAAESIQSRLESLGG